MTTTWMRSIIGRTIGILALGAAMTALGCGGYTLRGKVVQGTSPGVELVHEIDARLKGPGLANAQVMVRRDPDSMHPILAGQNRSDSTGDFAISIKEFGAGWMEEQWLVQSAASGFDNTEVTMKLPSEGSKWRLLITLAPGSAIPLEAPDDIMQDYEKFK